MKTTMQTADRATYQFTASADAWAFSNACMDRGIPAGFASTDGRHTVVVFVATWMVREAIEALASGAPCVDYRFAA